MPARQPEKPHAEPQETDRRQRNAVIGNHVIHSLGQPGTLQRVQVRPLWAITTG